MKSHINVVGAAIVKDGKILALRRTYGDEQVIHKFEFVGGKVEEGETPEEALIRECREELSLDIKVRDLLNTINYDYPKTSVTLSVYFVEPLSDYELKVHDEESWIECDKLDANLWAPADRFFLASLKNGYTKTRIAENEDDFATIKRLSEEIMHEAFDASSPEGQVDYMINLFLSPKAIKKNISEKEYTYKIIYLNGEAAGFFAYCPAKFFHASYTEGTFVSKIYIKKFARGKRLTSKLFASISRPVYLSVKKDNLNAINMYKHYGFKILNSVKQDIGGGFFMDDFIMILNK